MSGSTVGRKIALFALALFLALPAMSRSDAPVSTTASPPAAKSKAAASPRLQANYGKIPLSFEVNRGQTDKQVKFLSRGKGYSLFLTPTEAVFALTQAVSGKTKTAKHSPFDADEPPMTKTTTALRMQLVGANKHPQMEGQKALPGIVNYFLGNDPKKWHTNITTYSKVRCRQVYPGVDLVYYGNQRQLEYDFVVAPKADPTKIGFNFAGARQVRVDKAGGLSVSLVSGELHWHKPIVYQQVNRVRKSIAGRYVLQGKKQVGFQVARYDASKPLVIDPVLVYSTYLGGNGDDFCSDIAVDTSGNAYVVGATTSTNFPGAGTKTSKGTNYYVFVSKLAPDGKSLVYSTYLGGTGNDVGYGITSDTSGNAYVTGKTNSSDFPTTAGVFQTTYGGAGTNNWGDAFVAKINSTGGLVYSTYLGGSGDDRGVSIKLDGGGNIYVAGIAGIASTSFPVTAGALQTTFGGGSNDGFVTKLNSTATQLIYSTFLGGGSGDGIAGIAVDSSGDAYVSGTTQSSNFPVTSGAYQRTFVSGGPNYTDAFVTKLNPSGSSLVYSTFYGALGAGSGDTYGQAIAIDNSGNAYMTGQTGAGTTTGHGLPVVGGFQSSFASTASLSSVFIVKFNSSGSQVLYSSYLSGSDSDTSITGEVGLGIAVDGNQVAYVTGWADSSSFPVTTGAYQTSYGGGSNPTVYGDAFFAKIDTEATGSASLLYCTYLGGSADEQGKKITLDGAGNIYIAGNTASGNFPGTTGFYQAAHANDQVLVNGQYQYQNDGFIAKFSGPRVLSLTVGHTPPADASHNMLVGMTATATVTLDTPAVKDFAAIHLSAPGSGGNIRVPATIYMMHGDTTQTFVIDSDLTTTPGAYTISAQYESGPAVTATVNVQAATGGSFLPHDDAYINADSVDIDPLSGLTYATTNYGSVNPGTLIIKTANQTDYNILANRVAYLKFFVYPQYVPQAAILKLTYKVAPYPQAKTLTINVYSFYTLGGASSQYDSNNYWAEVTDNTQTPPVPGITWNNAPGLNTPTPPATWGSTNASPMTSATVLLEPGVTAFDMSGLLHVLSTNYASLYGEWITLQVIEGGTSNVGASGIQFYSKDALSPANILPTLILEYSY